MSSLTTTTSMNGSFRRLPFSETLAMLRNREGALSIHNMFACPDSQIFIKNGVLKELYVANQQITDYATVQAYIQRISLETEGDFTFIVNPLSPTLSLNIPIGNLIVQTRAEESSDSINENLPHRQTRFRLIRKPSRGEFQDDTKLLHFYTSAFRWLRTASSAEELAANVSLPCVQVQFYLHQLRTLGLISPVRAFAKPAQQDAAPSSVAHTTPVASYQNTAVASPQKASSSKSQSSMVSRLLKALKGA